MRDPQQHALGRPRVGPFPKLSEIRCFFSVFRGFGAHIGRGVADAAAGATRRWVGVMEGPTGASLALRRYVFLALKNRNFRPFGSRNGSKTAQKRLEERPSIDQGHGQRFFRNSSETARETSEFRPRSRPALFLEVINDHGELHCHRTRHRGGRAPGQGAPRAVFPDALLV
jgi:hypothetical protein